MLDVTDYLPENTYVLHGCVVELMFKEKIKYAVVIIYFNLYIYFILNIR